MVNHVGVLLGSVNGRLMVNKESIIASIVEEQRKWAQLSKVGEHDIIVQAEECEVEYTKVVWMAQVFKMRQSVAEGCD